MMWRFGFMFSRSRYFALLELVVIAPFIRRSFCGREQIAFAHAAR
jgi:hypothetical protein